MRRLKVEKLQILPVTITEEQAKTRYNLGSNNLNKLAKEAGAVVYYGRKKLFLVQRIDAYMEYLAG